MRKLFIKLLFLAAVISFSSCGKGGGGGTPTPTPTEENLNVKLNTNNPAIALSSSHTFTVEVLSKMPSSGVKIDITAKKESDNTVVYSTSLTSSTAVNSVTISGLPMGQAYCLTNVTVTSVSKPANTWNGSFRVVWK